MNKIKIIQAWSIFFCGLAIEIAIHYLIRINTNIEITKYEIHWFIVQIALAIIAAYFLINGTTNVASKLKRLLVIGTHLSIGYFLYLAILLWYVIGTGLDSL